MSESFPKSSRSELRSESDANRALYETVNGAPASPIQYIQADTVPAYEAANDPLVLEAVTEEVKWQDGIDYVPPVQQPEIEHITIEAPQGDLADPEEMAKVRGRLKALQNIEKWEQEEREAAQKTSFLGRIKRWFTREKQDDRTLEERMADMDTIEK